MVEELVQHKIQWLTPSPMWSNAETFSGGAVNGVINRPAILRFASDTFMEELMAVLQFYPRQLREWVAQQETWRDPMLPPATLSLLKINEPTAQSELQLRQKLLKVGRLPKDEVQKGPASRAKTVPSKENLPFKLYQPAHQRFYLVATSLVCRQFGLPDREVDPGKQEQVSFVMRRLIHPNPDNDHSVCNTENWKQYEEYAFVMTPNGGAWRNITGDPLYRVDELLPEEERLPLFPIHFSIEDGRKRRLLAGLIPVGSRELYMSASQCIPDPTQINAAQGTGQDQTVSDLRMVLFETQVAAPWRALLEQAADQKARLVDTTIPNPFEGEANAPTDRIRGDRENVIKTSREQIQTVSWYILLDLAKFLEKHLANVWNMVSHPNLNTKFSNPNAEQRIFNSLMDSRLKSRLKTELREDIGDPNADIKGSMREALKAISDLGIENFESTLESVEELYEMPPTVVNQWPSFFFPLADPKYPDDILLPNEVESSDLDSALLGIDELTTQVEAALPPEQSVPDSATLLTDDQILDKREGWFLIRCVYERPNCGPFNPPIVSRPTEPFQMAAFFDPDAPARPIRIPMPVDVSPAGLRKFKKNTAFMISDMLCGHIKRIRKLTLGDLVLSILPWPFHKDLPRPDSTGPCTEGPGKNFGMFCSLSIPIVTLCALILLIIIVNLFDTFFRWVPYLFMCFKLPGFEAKK